MQPTVRLITRQFKIQLRGVSWYHFRSWLVG